MQSNARAVGAGRTASTAGRSPGVTRLVAWSFALPFLILFLVFMAGPILVALVTSFTDLRVTDIRNPLSSQLRRHRELRRGPRRRALPEGGGEHVVPTFWSASRSPLPSGWERRCC